MAEAHDEGVLRESWFLRLRNPYLQAIVAAAFMLVVILIGGLTLFSGGELSERWAYQTLTTALMIFAVSNALMSLAAPNIGKYWTGSMLSYAALAGLAVLGARLLSGFWIAEAGSYRWIFMVVTFGYGVFLSIMAAIRGIVNFAEGEEWSQPRKR